MYTEVCNLTRIKRYPNKYHPFPHTCPASPATQKQ